MSIPDFPRGPSDVVGIAEWLMAFDSTSGTETKLTRAFGDALAARGWAPTVRQSAQAEPNQTRLDGSRMGIPSDSNGALPVKPNDLLSVTSILSVLLLALHISQDIVFGMDRAGLNQLVGVAILLVLVASGTIEDIKRYAKDAYLYPDGAAFYLRERLALHLG